MPPLDCAAGQKRLVPTLTERQAERSRIGNRKLVQVRQLFSCQIIAHPFQFPVIGHSTGGPDHPSDLFGLRIDKEGAAGAIDEIAMLFAIQLLFLQPVHFRLFVRIQITAPALQHLDHQKVLLAKIIGFQNDRPDGMHFQCRVTLAVSIDRRWRVLAVDHQAEGVHDVPFVLLVEPAPDEIAIAIQLFPGRVPVLSQIRSIEPPLLSLGECFQDSLVVSGRLGFLLKIAFEASLGHFPSRPAFLLDGFGMCHLVARDGRRGCKGFGIFRPAQAFHRHALGAVRINSPFSETLHEGNTKAVGILTVDVEIRGDHRAQIVTEGDVDRRAIIDRPDAHAQHMSGRLPGFYRKAVGKGRDECRPPAIRPFPGLISGRGRQHGRK